MESMPLMLSTLLVESSQESSQMFEIFFWSLSIFDINLIIVII